MIMPTAGAVMAGCDREAIKNGWRIERYKPRGREGHNTGRPERRYLHLELQVAVWVTFVDASPAARLSTKHHEWLQTELNAGRFATAIDSIRAFDRLLQQFANKHNDDALRMCKALVEFASKKTQDTND